MSGPRARRLPLALALAALMLGCGGVAERSSLPNLVIVSIDTLRADRLGSYGYPRATSPRIDALAARGVRVEGVVAESSWTLPSHMTLLTGRHPTSHGVTGPVDALPADIPTLAEILVGHGYRTAAETSGGFVHGRFGFDRGFQHYGDARRDFSRVLQAARQRIESMDEAAPWFLFLHTYDVHCPYGAPAPVLAAFRTQRLEDPVDPDACGAHQFSELTLRPEQLRDVSDRYDAGVRHADDQLGAFLDFLDAGGHFEDTLFVLTSDHGEELGEHGLVGHEGTLRVESLHVPLILVAPGLAPRVIQGGAGLVDLVPTLLELLGLDPLPDGDGHSLVSRMRGETEGEPHPRFSELDFRARLRSVVLGDEQRIFDLRSADDEAAAGTRDPLRDALDRHLATLERPAAVPTAGAPPDEVEDLRALGYVR